MHLSRFAEIQERLPQNTLVLLGGLGPRNTLDAPLLYATLNILMNSLIPLLFIEGGRRGRFDRPLPTRLGPGGGIRWKAGAQASAEWSAHGCDQCRGFVATARASFTANAVAVIVWCNQGTIGIAADRGG